MAINYEEKRQQNQEQVNYDYFAHDENQHEQGFFEKYKPDTPDDRKRKKPSSEKSKSAEMADSITGSGSFMESGKNAGFLLDNGFSLNPNLAKPYSTEVDNSKPSWMNVPQTDDERWNLIKGDMDTHAMPDLDRFNNYDELSNFFNYETYYGGNVTYSAVLAKIKNENSEIIGYNDSGRPIVAFDEDNAMKQAKEFINSLYTLSLNKNNNILTRTAKKWHNVATNDEKDIVMGADTKEYRERLKALRNDVSGDERDKEMRQYYKQRFRNEAKELREGLDESDFKHARFVVDNMTRSIAKDYADGLQERLDKVNDELKKMYSTYDQTETIFSPTGFHKSKKYRIDENGSKEYLNDYDEQNYILAKKKLTRAIRHARRFAEGKSTTWVPLINGAGDILTFGIESMYETMNKVNLAKKARSGVELNDSEKTLATAIKSAEDIDEMIVDVDKYSGYEVMDIFKDAIIFMEGLELAGPATKSIGLVANSGRLSKILEKGTEVGIEKGLPSLVKGIKASEKFADKAAYVGAKMAFDAEYTLGTTLLTPLMYNEIGRKYSGDWKMVKNTETGEDEVIMSNNDFFRAQERMNMAEAQYKNFIDYTQRYIEAVKSGKLDEFKGMDKQSWIDWCNALDLDPEGTGVTNADEAQRALDLIDEVNERLYNIAVNRMKIGNMYQQATLGQSIGYGFGSAMRENFTEFVVGGWLDDAFKAVGKSLHMPKKLEGWTMKGQTPLQRSLEWQQMNALERVKHLPNKLWQDSRHGFASGALNSAPTEILEEYAAGLIPNAFASPLENEQERDETLTAKFLKQTTEVTLMIGLLGSARAKISDKYYSADDRRNLKDIMAILDNIKNNEVEAKKVSDAIHSIMGDMDDGKLIDPLTAMNYLYRFNSGSENERHYSSEKNFYIQQFMNRSAALAARLGKEQEFIEKLKEAKESVIERASDGTRTAEDVKATLDMYDKIADRIQAFDDIKAEYGDRFWINDIIDSEWKRNMYRDIMDSYYGSIWGFFNANAVNEDEGGVLDESTKKDMLDEILNMEIGFDENGRASVEDTENLRNKIVSSLANKYRDTVENEDGTISSKTLENFIDQITLYNKAKELYNEENAYNKKLKSKDADKAMNAYSDMHKQSFMRNVSMLFTDLKRDDVTRLASDSHIQLDEKEINEVLYNANKDSERKHIDNTFESRGIMMSEESKQKLIGVVKQLKEESKEEPIVINSNGRYYSYDYVNDNLVGISKDEGKKAGADIVDVDAVKIDFNYAAEKINELRTGKKTYRSPANNDKEYLDINSASNLAIEITDCLNDGIQVLQIFGELDILDNDYLKKFASNIINNWVENQKRKYLKNNNTDKLPDDINDIPKIRETRYKESKHLIDRWLNATVTVGTKNENGIVQTEVAFNNTDGSKPDKAPEQSNINTVTLDVKNNVTTINGRVNITIPNMSFSFKINDKGELERTSATSPLKNILVSGQYECEYNDGNIYIDSGAKNYAVIPTDFLSGNINSYDHIINWITYMKEKLSHKESNVDNDVRDKIYELLDIFENKYMSSYKIRKGDFESILEKISKYKVDTGIKSFNELVDNINNESDENKKSIEALTKSLQINGKQSVTIEKNENGRVNHTMPKELSFYHYNPESMSGTSSVLDNEIVVYKADSEQKERIYLNPKNCENYYEVYEQIMNYGKKYEFNSDNINIIYWKEPNGNYRAVVPDTANQTDERANLCIVRRVLKNIIKTRYNSNYDLLDKFVDGIKKECEAIGIRDIDFSIIDNNENNIDELIELIKHSMNYVTDYYPENNESFFKYKNPYNPKKLLTFFIDSGGNFYYKPISYNELCLKCTACTAEFIPVGDMRDDGTSMMSNNTHPDIVLSMPERSYAAEIKLSSDEEINKASRLAFENEHSAVESLNNNQESETPVEEAVAEGEDNESDEKQLTEEEKAELEDIRKKNEIEARRVNMAYRRSSVRKKLAEALFHRLILKFREQEGKKLTLENLYDNIDDVISKFESDLRSRKFGNIYANILVEDKDEIIGWGVGLNANKFATVKFFIDNFFNIKSTTDYIDDDEIADEETAGMSDEETVDFTKDYSREVYEREIAMSMSMSARMQFVGIRKTVSRMSGENDTVEEYEDPNDMYYAMHDLMYKANTNDIDELKAYVAKNIKKINKAQRVSGRNGKNLEYESDFSFLVDIIGSLERCDEKTRNEILSILYTDKVDMVFCAVEKNNSASMYKANNNDPEIRFRLSLRNNMKNSEILELTRNGRYRLKKDNDVEKTRIKEISEIVSRIKDAVKSSGANIGYDDYMKFKYVLKDLGLDANDAFYMNVFENGGTGEGSFLDTVEKRAKMLSKMAYDNKEYEFNIEYNSDSIFYNPDIYMKTENGYVQVKENYNARGVIGYTFVKGVDFYYSTVYPFIETNFIPTYGMYVARKRIASYEIPRFYKEQFKNIVNSIKNKNSDFYKDMTTSEYIKYSPLYRFLIDNPSFAKNMKIEQYSLQSVKRMNYRSTQDNRELPRLTDMDRLITLMSGFTQNISIPGSVDRFLTKLPFIAISDSRSIPCITTAGFYVNRNDNGKINILDNKNITTNEELIDDVEKTSFEESARLIYENVILPEIKRIIAFRKNTDKSTGVKGVDIGSQIITSFAELNALVVEDNDGLQMTLLEYIDRYGSNRKYDHTNVEKAIKSHVEEYVKNYVNGMIMRNRNGYEGKFVDYDIFTNDINKYDEKQKDKNITDDEKKQYSYKLQYVNSRFINEMSDELDKNLKNKTDNENSTAYMRTRHLAIEYFTNLVITHADVNMLFMGDPANYYKDSSVPKKNFISHNNWGYDMSKFTYDNDVNKYNEDGKTLTKEWKEAANNAYLKIIDSTRQNMIKRSKELVSPGMKKSKFGEDKIVQIMLNDQYGPSENIVDLANNLHNLNNTDYNEKLKTLLESYEKKPDEETLKEIKEQVPEIGDYIEMELTNAQEYVTWKTHLNTMYKRGKLTDEQYRTIFNKLQSQSVNGLTKDNALTREESKGIFQTEKPLYSGQSTKTVGTYKFKRFVYVKTSAMVLLPSLTIGTELDEIRKRMEAVEYDANNFKLDENNHIIGRNNLIVTSPSEFKVGVRLSFNSGNKVGAPKNSMSLGEFLGTNAGELYSSDRFAETSTMLNGLNFSIQQDKPFDKHKSVNSSTQWEKIIFGNGISSIDDEIFEIDQSHFKGLKFLGYDKKLKLITGDVKFEKGKAKVSGKKLYEIYTRIYSAMEYQLEKELTHYFKTDDISKIMTDEDAFDKMIEYLDNRLTNIQDLEALRKVYVYRKKDGSGVVVNTKQYSDEYIKENELELRRYDFNIPVWALPNAKRFETLLNSIIRQKMIKYQMPGGAGLVATQESFKTMDKEKFDNEYATDAKNGGIVYVEGYDPSKGLSKSMENGRPVYECIIANKYRDQNGNIIDLTEFINEKGYIDTKRFSKELLEIPSVRIPVSSHQSGMLLKVVGFVPYESGDVLVAHKDALVQLGEDYDIDVRYFYTYNTVVHTDDDGKVKKIRRINADDINEKVQIGVEYAPKPDMEKILSETIILNKEAIRKRSDKIKYADLPSADMIKNIVIGYIKNKKYITSPKMDDKDIKKVALLIYDKCTITGKETKKRKSSLCGIIEHIVKNYIDTTAKRMKDESGRINYDILEKLNVTMKECLQNALIGVYKSIYSCNDRRIRRMIEPSLSTKFARDTVDMMDEKAGVKVDTRSFFDPDYQNDQIKNGNSGKNGVAFHSSFLTLSSLCQIARGDDKNKHIMPTTSEGKNIELIFGDIQGIADLSNILAINPQGKDTKRRDILFCHDENQNCSVDNINLQIMPRRNENSNTIGIFATMAALGIDKDIVGGVERHYPSIFMKQPVVVRFSQLCDRYYAYLATVIDPETGRRMTGDSIREYIYGILENELGNVFKSDDYEKINEYKKKLTGNELMKYQGKDLSSIEDDESRKIQFAVLENMKQILSIQKNINKLQKILNIEKNGLGNSFFNTLELREFLMLGIDDLEKGGIRNAKRLIGDFKELEHKADKKDVDDEGYYFVGTTKDNHDVYIRPTTITGIKIVHSVRMGCNMLEQMFPYDNPIISSKIDRICNSMDYDKHDVPVYIKEDIKENLMDYMYTELLARANKGTNIDYMREHLFMDSWNNTSLAGYLVDVLKKSSIFKKMDFFKDIELKPSFTEPSTIRYNAGFESVDTRNKASDVFHEMCNGISANLVICDDNGNPILWDGSRITRRELAFNLLAYSILANQENGATGFRQYIPLSVYESFGLARIQREIFNLDNMATDGCVSFDGIKGEILALVGGDYDVTTIGAEIDVTRFVESQNSVWPVIKIVDDINSRYPINVIKLVKSRNGNEMNYRYSIIQNVSVAINMDENNFVMQYFQHNPYRAKKYVEKNSDGKFKIKMFEDMPDELDVTEDNETEFVSVTDKNGKSGVFMKTIVLDQTHSYVEKYVLINSLGSRGFNEYSPRTTISNSLGKNNYENERYVFDGIALPTNISLLNRNTYNIGNSDRVDQYVGFLKNEKNNDSYYYDVVPEYSNEGNMAKFRYIFGAVDDMTISDNMKMMFSGKSALEIALRMMPEMNYTDDDVHNREVNRIKDVATFLSRMNIESYPQLVVEDSDEFKDKDYRGKYKDGKIYLNVAKIRSEFPKENEQMIVINKTILHEFIHHLTSDTIGKYLTVYYDNNGVNIRYNDNVDINNIPSEIVKIKMIWEEAYRKLSSEYNLMKDAVIDIINNDSPSDAGYSDEAKRMAYAMHDVNEMFVSMFFDKTFQDKMAKVEYKNSGESLFRKFASAVFRLFKKLFGGARTDTLAASMFESFCELIQNNVQTELFRPVKLEAYDISSDPEINEDFILNKKC